MAFKSGLGRSLVLAGVLTCTAVALAGGTAYAASSPKPKPHATATPAPHASSTHRKTTTLTTRTPAVAIRSVPKKGKKSRVLVTLATSGSKVTVSCHTTGADIGGDRTWYRTVSPRAGFVAGHQLTIRKEPATGVPACTKKK